MTFEQLGLTDELLKAVTEQGYITPTPVQQKAIPLILEGRDVLAGAQTGTGKPPVLPCRYCNVWLKTVIPIKSHDEFAHLFWCRHANWPRRCMTVS